MQSAGENFSLDVFPWVRTGVAVKFVSSRQYIYIYEAESKVKKWPGCAERNCL